MKRPLAVGVLVVFAIILSTMAVAGLGATDEQAVATIEDKAPDYSPWASSVWSPPGGYGELALFALQGGVAAFVLAYYVERLRDGTHAPDA
ncbi:cobalt ABC transporter substrate-binding protein (plasmid) [Haloferax mediterranei ATCC 33500]|uniref:CbiN protein ( ABC-type cobalt transport system, periplasmic component) n=1 Tax=Haloferax mediterranei (strain ATCC 33500 / DSM 1411 / JCM 8866 / NBRC 14739 / NCIMB 2177 / R-4) TaxID=523841 RepID=I3R9J5_HALMT|nr:energy-coupling factor ABC transporter substrate-binding protein [Haloferax mediterranei]AFK20905.1 CbiN protein (ABC-type cobalt transport system, periplasmic component) [Haloferax mediterranei ATCC 33500]AHZ24226.1 cobalt ABC transporter substrate-binding protein [Haloferax mediterranei ATCC 33500]EMA05305.1 CbiN protein (ABC-type cobalt transport system, periplasmic component) [Haloferax mediterranei ATCC 33500]MDX5989893.1 energy-coupling factor ABC transporter substrate-binding protein 